MSYPKQYNIQDFKAEISYNSSSKKQLVQINTVILYFSYSTNTNNHLIHYTEGKRVKSLSFSKIEKLINLENDKQYNQSELYDWFYQIEKEVPFVYLLPKGIKTTQLRQILPLKVSGNWAEGMRFCITGSFNNKDGEIFFESDRVYFLKIHIEKLGGTITSNISGLTDIILVGHNPGEKKLKECKKRNIHMVDIEKFFILVKKELDYDI